MIVRITRVFESNLKSGIKLLIVYKNLTDLKACQI